jgi:hypothetical protein
VVELLVEMLEPYRGPVYSRASNNSMQLSGCREPKTLRASLGPSMGLVNLLVPAAQIDPKLVEEEIMRAQQDCMESWEIEAANRAWDASKTDVRFYARPL